MLKIYLQKKNFIKKTIVLYLALTLTYGALVPLVGADITDPWWNPDWQYRK